VATILIADDDPDIRKLLNVTLRNRGHDVIQVESGATVLETVERVTPDLAILDVNMPGMDGTRVARALRARPATAGMPIIFLTALAGETDVLAAFASGADDYVTKPFSPRELGVRVAALLARAGSGTGPAARPQGRVIAIAGPKGGAGRTTVAVNLALAMQQRDRAQRTLLVEGSLLMGDIAVHLDLRSNRSLLDLLPYAGRLDVAVLESVLVRHRSGLEVLLRPQAPEQAERITPALFGETLQGCAAIADTVLVDLKAAYDDECVLAALEAASTLLLVLTPEIGALRNARAFLDLAPKLGLQHSRTHVVLNRVHDRAGLTARDVAGVLPVAPLEELPDIGPAATGLVNVGTPVVEADPRSELARRLQRLAAALADVGTASAR
jgi:pilus assembly protein CpaE